MTPALGCIIVTYNAADVLAACLDSLAEAADVDLRVVIVDNASRDRTLQIARTHGLAPHVIAAAHNKGFAAGVNIGLEWLEQNSDLDRFWILNPDCIVPPLTPAKLARYPMPFALLGNRLVYADNPDRIQIDAGTVNRWTGATGNLGLGKFASVTPLPPANTADFISGASMVASRAFLNAVGPMPEQYFLYYEEVHWAQHRAQLPLALCENAEVLHSAGSSIGSATLDRGPSALSVYFKHRARMKFVAHDNPIALPVAYLFGLGKLIQHVARKQWRAVVPLLRALHGFGPGESIGRQIAQAPYAATKSRKVSSNVA